MSDLSSVSTAEILHELQRRYQVLSRPEKSVLIASTDEPEKIANGMKKHFGTCVIAPSEELAKDPLHMRLTKISGILSTPQCRRGFAIYGLSSKEELEGFDRMLSQDFGGKKYSVVGWRGETLNGKPVVELDKDKELTFQLDSKL